MVVYFGKFLFFWNELRNSNEKNKYNMASVVGSSYVSQELRAILVFLEICRPAPKERVF